MRFLLPFLLSFTASLAADKLIFASVLWRHGQRAPSRINGVDGVDVFKRGAGQLTEAGMTRSIELGQTLRRRFVHEQGILSGRVEDKEQFVFHSTSVQRCKDTLQLVASGLFKEEDDVIPHDVNAPIKTVITNIKTTPAPNDFLIGFTWHTCPALGKIFQAKCENYPDITTLKDYHKFEQLSFKCSKAGDDANTFTTPQRSTVMESVILLADSGAIRPEWMTNDLIQEAREVMSKTLRWQLGLGEYRDEKVLKLSVGLLLNTIIGDMKAKWACRGNTAAPASCKVAFKGYSTHDYILNSLLELLGAAAREEALRGFLNPQMSAAILVELWEVGGAPKVKVLYRPYALASSLRDLTPTISHCKAAEACDLTTFENGYASLLTENPQEDCNK